MAIRDAQEAMRRSGLPSDVLNKATWESWTTEREWQKKVLETARKFVERSLQEPGAWFYIGGRPGAGKTKLCSIIFRALNEGGIRGRYISWRDFSQRVKGDQLDNEKRDALMRPVLDAPVLYVDDLWKGGQSTADIKLTFDILNARYQRPDSITLISAEYSLDAVIVGDEAIGSRIAERAQGFTLDVTKAEDYRLRRAR